MKILIRDAESQLYLSSKGQWCASADEAEDFFTATHALYVARVEAVQDFQIVLYSPSAGRPTSVLENPAQFDEELYPTALLQTSPNWGF